MLNHVDHQLSGKQTCLLPLLPQRGKLDAEKAGDTTVITSHDREIPRNADALLAAILQDTQSQLIITRKDCRQIRILS